MEIRIFAPVFALGFFCGTAFALAVLWLPIREARKWYESRLDYWRGETMKYLKLWQGSRRAEPRDEADWWKK